MSALERKPVETLAPLARRAGPVVTIAAGVATVGAAVLALFQYLGDATDQRLSEMLSTADGARAALERIADAIAEDAALVGADQEEATALARAVGRVTDRATGAAAARGLRVTPTDVWGEQVTFDSHSPTLFRSSDGIDYGVSVSEVGGGHALYRINNAHIGGRNPGDMIEYTVGADTCRIFHQRARERRWVDAVMRCD